MPSTPDTPPAGTPPTAGSPTPPTTPPATAPVVVATTTEKPKNWWQKTSRWGKVGIIALGLFVAILMINATNQPRPKTYVIVGSGQSNGTVEVDGVVVVPATGSVQSTAVQVDPASLYDTIKTKAKTLEGNLKTMRACQKGNYGGNSCQEASLAERQKELATLVGEYNLAMKSEGSRYPELPKELDAAGKPV